jgi:cytochrome c553
MYRYTQGCIKIMISEYSSSDYLSSRHLDLEHLNRYSHQRYYRNLLTSCILALTGFFSTSAISTPEEIIQALELTPNIDNGKKIYPLCASCHMKNGWGKIDGSFPVIAGQHRNVLIKQLSDIRDKNRENPTMYPFTDPAVIGGSQGISDVTAYIAAMDKDPVPGVGPGKNLDLAKKLYQKQCSQCHGEQGQGNNDAFFPSLKGQHYAYLLRQLKWIRDGYRKNANPAMVTEVKVLSDNELDAVADYLSRL